MRAIAGRAALGAIAVAPAPRPLRRRRVEAAACARRRLGPPLHRLALLLLLHLVVLIGLVRVVELDRLLCGLRRGAGGRGGGGGGAGGGGSVGGRGGGGDAGGSRREAAPATKAEASATKAEAPATKGDQACALKHLELRIGARAGRPLLRRRRRERRRWGRHSLGRGTRLGLDSLARRLGARRWSRSVVDGLNVDGVPPRLHIALVPRARAGDVHVAANRFG